MNELIVSDGERLGRRMAEPDLDRREALCRDVALAAGQLALAAFARSHRVTMKGPQDYLTEADAEVEAYIRSTIAAAFPEDGFFGEETGGVTGGDVWVVDPIDGTANFARSIPHFCVSIAFVSRGRVEIGAICSPCAGELYFARRGAGATRNGEPIRVATTSVFSRASLELGWSPRVPNQAYVEALSKLLACGANVRRAGSGALGLAYVADGRSDGYAELHMNAWDCLAGLLLVEEAGGATCDFLGIGSLQGGGAVLAVTPAIAGDVSRATGIPLKREMARS